MKNEFKRIMENKRSVISPDMQEHACLHCDFQAPLYGLLPDLDGMIKHSFQTDHWLGKCVLVFEFFERDSLECGEVGAVLLPLSGLCVPGRV